MNASVRRHCGRLIGLIEKDTIGQFCHTTLHIKAALQCSCFHHLSSRLLFLNADVGLFIMKIKLKLIVFSSYESSASQILYFGLTRGILERAIPVWTMFMRQVFPSSPGVSRGVRSREPRPGQSTWSRETLRALFPFAWRHVKWVFAYSDDQDPPGGEPSTQPPLNSSPRHTYSGLTVHL